MKILSFDIGGTKIAYSLSDENGCLLVPSEKSATPANVHELETLLKKIVAGYDADIDAVAISTAGTVNIDNSRVISGGNLPQGYTSIDFSSLSSKPVFIENDANCAVWAEYKQGAARGMNNVVLLTLGTGVGVGLVLDGRLFRGKSGAAGEVHFRYGCGHHRKCGCGRYDCLEIYMSGRALNLEAKEVYHDEHATSYDVIEGLKNGDERAKTAFENWQGHVTEGCVLFADIFDPDVIVLGGSMARFINYDEVERLANAAIVSSPFKLREAAFANDAGIIGAALLCAEKLLK